MNVMRDAILNKYSFLKYYYTNLFLLSTDDATVGAFYKPLFFEFPNDLNAYKVDPSENVMLGSALKLSVRTSPINGTNFTDSYNLYYFPQGNWCDLLSPDSVCVYAKNAGKMELLPSGLSDVQVHLRDGYIVPM